MTEYPENLWQECLLTNQSCYRIIVRAHIIIPESVFQAHLLSIFSQSCRFKFSNELIIVRK